MKCQSPVAFPQLRLVLLCLFCVTVILFSGSFFALTGLVIGKIIVFLYIRRFPLQAPGGRESDDAILDFGDKLSNITRELLSFHKSTIA